MPIKIVPIVICNSVYDLDFNLQRENYRIQNSNDVKMQKISTVFHLSILWNTVILTKTQFLQLHISDSFKRPKKKNIFVDNNNIINILCLQNVIL